MKLLIKYFLLIAIISPIVTFGQIELPKNFTSNMVLPRDKAIPIKGKAKPNETLEITIKDQVHKLKTDKW